MRLAICMAIYGRDNLTDAVLSQIQPELDLVDVYICDNAGGFAAPAWVNICSPGKNIGWLAGTNLAWQMAIKSNQHYDGFVLLNNDVILSPNFFRNMASSLKQPKAGILAPQYDDCSRFQLAGRYSAAAHVSKNVTKEAPYVDGTCMIVTREAFLATGFLDDVHFGFFGWGADIDYCIRVRENGFKVLVSQGAYLNHIGKATASTITNTYKRQALYEYRVGMTRKYGRFWGRYLETSLLRKLLKTARGFLTSFAPSFTLAKG